MKNNAQAFTESSKSGPFEFQNWPVYKQGVSVAKEAQKFCLAVPKNGNLSLCDQFKRASQSIVLNIAEGSSRTSIKDKVNFARVSKGSVFECAAIVDLALEFELLNQQKHGEFQGALANIGRMLSGIIRHFEKQQ
jgi:four helix bundle protein